MASKNSWRFTSFEDLYQKWSSDQFICDDIADFTDSLVLDWCSRLDDWAPKVALCFNRKTSAVTLDRISQHDMPELRRLVCFHQNCSVETLERLLGDNDRFTAESAAEQLDRVASSYGKQWRKSRPRPTAKRKTASRRRTPARR